MLLYPFFQQALKIQSFVDKLEELNNPNYLILSIAAKAFYILKNESKSMTVEEIRNKANKFDWGIDKKGNLEAIKILEKLELVE